MRQAKPPTAPPRCRSRASQPTSCAGRWMLRPSRVLHPSTALLQHPVRFRSRTSRSVVRCLTGRRCSRAARASRGSLRQAVLTVPAAAPSIWTRSPSLESTPMTPLSGRYRRSKFRRAARWQLATPENWSRSSTRAMRPQTRSLSGTRSMSVAPRSRSSDSSPRPPATPTRRPTYTSRSMSHSHWPVSTTSCRRSMSSRPRPTRSMPYKRKSKTALPAPPSAPSRTWHRQSRRHSRAPRR